MTTKKLTLGYLPNIGTGRVSPFDDVFQDSFPIDYSRRGGVDLNQITKKNMDAVVIWGGEDICPKIYGEAPSQNTYAHSISFRDRLESSVILKAFEEKLPIIGVCRGAQLVCALSGGKLVQHVTNHGNYHEIVTQDGEEYVTSSVHHQMMWPWEVKHDLLAWSKTNRSDIYVFNDKNIKNKIEEKEAEIVFFPDTKSLAIQGHPEFMSRSSPFVSFCNRLVEKYIIR